MMKSIEELINRNGLKYESSGNTILLKLGGLTSKVKITYDNSTNTYKLNCNEMLLVNSSLLLFFGAILMLASADGMFGVISAGLCFAGGLINLFTVVVTQVKLLDLKTQLRSAGIYLLPRT